MKVVAVSLTKIANDLAWMGSGRRPVSASCCCRSSRRARRSCRARSTRSSRGRPPGRGAGDRKRHRDHGGRHAGQLRAERAHPAHRPQPARPDQAAHVGDDAAARSADGIEANEEMTHRHAESTPAIATALNPYIGYDKATEIVKEAIASKRTIRRSPARGRRRGNPRQSPRPDGDGPPPRREVTRNTQRALAAPNSAACRSPRPTPHYVWSNDG